MGKHSSLGRFVGFLFQPIRPLPTALGWVPVVIPLVAVGLALVGLSIPHKVHLSRPWSFALAASALAALFLVAAIRLWLAAHPQFPLHRVSFSNPGLLKADEERGEEWRRNARILTDEFLLLDMSYTNREARPASLQVELFWIWDNKVREKNGKLSALGPYACRTIPGPIGGLEFTEQPIEVGPHKTEPRIRLAFDSSMAFGIEEGPTGGIVTREGLRIFVRLTDLVSDATCDEPLVVAVKTAEIPT